MKFASSIVTGFGLLILVCSAAVDAQRTTSTPRPVARGGGTRGSGGPTPTRVVAARVDETVRQRIETSRGTCECVPYYNCDADNTVDTTIFKIRFPAASSSSSSSSSSGNGIVSSSSSSSSRVKRQIEERPEQCAGLYVCCLINGGNDNNNNNNNNNNGGDNNNNNNNGGDSNNNNNGGDNNNNNNGGDNNNNNNGGDNNNNNNNNNNGGDDNNNGNNNNNNGGENENQWSSTRPPCVCLPSYQCGQNDTEVFQGGKGILVPKQSCTNDDVLCCDKAFSGVTTESNRDPFVDVSNTCGTRNKNIEFNINRIQTAAGDGSTLFGEYPWMLVVLKTENLADGSLSGNVFLCGASLVRPNIVITAAHCVHKSNPSDLKVRAGEWDTRENNAAESLPYQEQRVRDIILHPRFNNGTLHNDIAILRLEDSFRLADNVGLVCLPNERSANPTSCIATGWGKEAFTKDSKYQNIMKQVSLPWVPSDECQAKLRETRLGKFFILDRSFTCAGGKSNEDTCQGDGGGPLSCVFEGDDQFYLVGITSWGIGCGMKNVPGVYTNVKIFSDWISTNIQ